MRAVRLHRHGGPEALTLEVLPRPVPQAGELLIRHTAIGVNFVDVYDRSGLYPMRLPGIPGREAAGVVDEVGPGVGDFRPGDRIVYTYPDPGSYCEYRAVPAERAVPLPASIDDRHAAAGFLKGLTAYYLVRLTHCVCRGEMLLVYAAAGAVGSLVAQWAHSLGALVIGVVGTREKAERARSQGCQHVLVEGQDDIPARVREITCGRGVLVVYDAVGAAMVDTSLACLARRGLWVSFGNASGPVGPVAPLELMRRGSLYLTRPTLIDYVPSRCELLRAAGELFRAIESAVLRIEIGQTFPLAAASEAHRALEARRTVAATILLP